MHLPRTVVAFLYLHRHTAVEEEAVKPSPARRSCNPWTVVPYLLEENY
jgi:hypothetical protein